MPSERLPDLQDVHYRLTISAVAVPDDEPPLVLIDLLTTSPVEPPALGERFRPEQWPGLVETETWQGQSSPWTELCRSWSDDDIDRMHVVGVTRSNSSEHSRLIVTTQVLIAPDAAAAPNELAVWRARLAEEEDRFDGLVSFTRAMARARGPELNALCLSRAVDKLKSSHIDDDDFYCPRDGLESLAVQRLRGFDIYSEVRAEVEATIDTLSATEQAELWLGMSRDGEFDLRDCIDSMSSRDATGPELIPRRWLSEVASALAHRINGEISSLVNELESRARLAGNGSGDEANDGR